MRTKQQGQKLGAKVWKTSERTRMRHDDRRMQRRPASQNFVARIESEADGLYYKAHALPCMLCPQPYLQDNGTEIAVKLSVGS